MELNNVAVVSKVGSKEAEDAAKKVAKKLLGKKSKVYTVSPVEVDGAKKIADLGELKSAKLTLQLRLAGTVLPFAHLGILKTRRQTLQSTLAETGVYFPK